MALGQRVEKEPKRVIPVLLPGAKERDIPSFLAQRTWVDFRAGLDDKAAFARLIAGIRGVAPGAEGSPAHPTPDDATMKKPLPDAGDDQPGAERLPWWRRARYLGIAIGVVGALLTTMAWLWPRQPTEPAPNPPPEPAIYSMRVQVLDPAGRPVEGSTIRASAGNEPQLLPDGWWEVEIPAAKVPLDRMVTIWAEHADWESEKVDLELANDPNPRAEVRLKVPESRIRGVVVDAGGNGVAGARVTARNYAAAAVVTDQDGSFELTVAAAREKRVRLHVEHPAYPAKDGSCYAGRDGCSLVLVDD